MVSGAPKPGGYRQQPPGGHRPPNAGGISYVGNGAWRAFSGYKSADFPGPLVASGARVVQSRTVANIRTESGTTATSILWTLPTAPATSTATVSNGTTATASFTPDIAGTYVLRCTVTFTGAAAPNTIVQDHTYVSA